MRRAMVDGSGVLVCALVVAGAGSASLGQVPIEAFAPRDSYLVATVPSFADVMDALDESSLGDLWREPSVQTWIEELTADGLSEMRTSMEEIGVDVDELEPPTGRVGVAAFFVSEVDEAGDEWPTQRLLVSAEFGDRADATMDAIWAVLDEWVEQDKAIVGDDEYRGATIIDIEWILPEEEEIEFPENDEDWENWTPPDPVMSPLGTLSVADHAFVARLDGLIVASDERGMVERAVDAALGDDVDAVADSRTYQDLAAQHPDGQHARLIFVLNDQLRELMTESLGYMTMMLPGVDPAAVIDVLGIMELRGAGMGLRLDGADGLVEMTHGLLIPEKRGLVAMFDTASSALEPPALAGADTAELTRVSIDFEALMPLARAVVATLDEEMRGQANMALELAATTIQPLLETIGPELYVLTDYDKPLHAGSRSFLVATPVRDELTVANVLAMVTAQAQGLFTARDFEGTAVYATEDGSIAHAVGYGHLLVGPLRNVEDALRQAANPGGATLASEPRFRAAIRVAGDEMMLGSYVDMEERLEWTAWQMDHVTEIMEQRIRDMDLPEEVRDEWLADMREQMEAEDQPTPPSMDVLLKYLGDLVTEMRSTPDGFRGRALLLRPRGD